MKISAQLATFILGCLMISSSPGRVYAQAQRINVKVVGAKGDGIHDDTQSILKAFSMILQKGGIVYFPEGNYLTNIIDIRPQKDVSVTVTGEGRKTIIKKNPNDKTHIALFFCEIPGVYLTFQNLSLEGSLYSTIPKWKTIKGKEVDVFENINGIYGYNLASLTVTGCEIKNFHGKGIAAYSSGKFIANNNRISNTSGSGLTGHRVGVMKISDNIISNTGFISPNYILDNRQYKRSDNFPLTKFGDGIEGESDTLIVQRNVILNPGRCGIVHDLAKDLGYKASYAMVTNNTITVKSENINNDNPPAGMWFEQSATVLVSNNKIYLRKSTSKLVSGIRFFDVTSLINCKNNVIDAQGYDHISDGGIGIYEPVTEKIIISNNIVSGNFTASVVLSYGSAQAKVDDLMISGNLFKGGEKGKANIGIQISIDGKRKFPATTNVIKNVMDSAIEKPYNLFYYGSQPVSIASEAIVNMSGNTIKGISTYRLPSIVGIKFLNQ